MQLSEDVADLVPRLAGWSEEGDDNTVRVLQLIEYVRNKVLDRGKRRQAKKVRMTTNDDVSVIRARPPSILDAVRPIEDTGTLWESVGHGAEKC